MNIARLTIERAGRCGSLPGLALAWLLLLPAAGFAQNATPVPGQAEGADPAVDDETEEAAADPAAKEVDPRTKAAVEEARQLRIERQTEIISNLPTEGGLLASTLAIPEGLVGSRGLRYGRVLLLPAATFGAAYTDNAGSGDQARDEDLSMNAAAAIRAQSLLVRHAFGVDATANTSHSFQSGNDDYFDWQLGADGRLDLTRRSLVSGRVGYSLDTESDSSIEAEGNAADVETITSSAGYGYRGNRISYQLDFGLDRTNFSGTDTGDRDQTTYRVSPRIAHRTTERLALFVSSQYAYSAFDQAVADDGESRDAQNATALVGADLIVSRALTLSGAAGYTRLFFTDSGRTDTDSLVANAALGWQVDPLTSLELTASRGLSLTNVDDASARTDTAFGLGASRQIGLDTGLQGSLRTTYVDFQDIDRNDVELIAGLGVAQRLSDHFFLSLAYQYQQRFSDADADFYENQVVLGFSVIY